MFKRVKLFAVAALAAVTVSACAAGPMRNAAQTEVMSFMDPGYQTLAVGESPAQFPRRMAAKLNLTADQQADLRAIAQKYRGSMHTEVMAHRQALKGLLVAPKVDAVALKAFINGRVAAFEAKAPAQHAMLSEMRAVLTPKQRETLATMLEQPVEPEARDHFDGLRRKMRTQMVANLGLTAPQQQALNALATKVDALRDQGPREEAKAAFARFVRTGDLAALQAARKGKLAASLPIDELVAVAASLTQTQRTQLVSKVETLARLHGR